MSSIFFDSVCVTELIEFDVQQKKRCGLDISAGVYTIDVTLLCQVRLRVERRPFAQAPCSFRQLIGVVRVTLYVVDG